MKYLAFVGLGSNIGSPIQNCEQAIERLRQEGEVMLDQVSSFYHSAPVGKIDQDWFVNCVVSLRTTFKPESLLDLLREIEQSMGRIRKERWGERIIDLDLLLYGAKEMETPYLTIPHPRLHERAFVLAPLAEIAPDAKHPKFNKSVADMLLSVSHQKLNIVVEEYV